jgi:hypothetical protein
MSTTTKLVLIWILGYISIVAGIIIYYETSTDRRSVTAPPKESVVKEQLFRYRVTCPDSVQVEYLAAKRIPRTKVCEDTSL